MQNKNIHFKLYKPVGMLSQLSSNDPREMRKKRFLRALYSFPEGTMPIGRLDEKSEGLLFMTTDGQLSDAVNRTGIEKEYYAQLDGLITTDAVHLLTKGIEIGLEGTTYRTKPCSARTLAIPPTLPQADKSLRIGRHRPSSWISITLTEGKYRQIRKMTAAVGFPTLRLVRVRIGSITLKGLLPGEVTAIPLAMEQLKKPN